MSGLLQDRLVLQVSEVVFIVSVASITAIRSRQKTKRRAAWQAERLENLSG
jgi:hypothetical protein